MSFLLIKAKQNIDVAKELITGAKYYAPIVHCSYYACLQMMIHVLLQNTTEEDLKKRAGSSSHEYYINEITKILRTTDPLTSKRFNENILQLRSFRNKSDYFNIEIKEAEAKKTQELSLDIKTVFINRLGIVWS